MIGRHVDRVSLIDTKQGPEWGETRASFFVLDIEIPLDGVDRFAAQVRPRLINDFRSYEAKRRKRYKRHCGFDGSVFE